MKPRTKKVLKWTGIIFGSLLLIIVLLGIYIYSIIPPTLGKPIVLQKELFMRPATPFKMEGKYIYKSATELAEMIRHKEATSTEVVTEFINNIKNNNYKYNSLIYLREEEALAEAKLADMMVSRGDTSMPLLGVPITIKEMFWVKGSPTTLNAKMYGVTAERDAAIVAQLKNAGAIVLGTTNVPFMLSDYQTQGEVYPTASNPYDTTRTPGGSTGGGAAALAAGFTTLELGSDMGGSIRVPAAFCGLWSLKPTVATINITDGTGPDSNYKYTRFAMASPGPLARTPEDLQLLWEIIRDTKIDPRFQKPVIWKEASGKTISQYRFAWIEEWNSENGVVKMSAGVKHKLRQLLDSLNAHMAITEKKAPDTYTSMEKMFLKSFASMMGEGQPWLIRFFIKMDMQKLNDGTSTFDAFNTSIMDASDENWNKIQAERKTLIDKWETFFKQYDFFICPITYGVAFKKCIPGSAIKADDGNTIAYINYVPYSFIFNATGHPCITVPMGLDSQGMPIGIQITGPYYSEPELLHVAQLLKLITPGFIKPTAYQEVANHN